MSPRRAHLLALLFAPSISCFEVEEDTGGGGGGGGGDSGGAAPPESCNGLDDDGDGATDEGFDEDGSGLADCFEACPGVLDFALDAGGAAVAAGQALDSAYAARGVRIAALHADRATPGAAIAFDSSVPTGGDDDLGTPNETYGGPGVGDGGASNAAALGNLLVRAANDVDSDGDGIIDVPNDAESGAWFEIAFDVEMCVHSLDLVDVEAEGGEILLYDAHTLVGQVPVPAAGDNSVQTVDLGGACGVRSLAIGLAGSGGVDNLSLCPGGSPEVCDGADNDGDGGVDEGAADSDGDGTCDAYDAEDCDGLDNDGDGAADEGFGDSDADGTPDCLDGEDCDDIDNDGDGDVDEGLTSVWYVDADNDGYGISDQVDVSCVPPTGYVAYDGDCDDHDAGLNPGTPEICDGIDNDCDGQEDEGFDADADGTADCFEICEDTLTFCSAADGLHTVDGGAAAVATWDGHASWTAAVPGAAWIWDEYLETDPEGGDVHSIFRSFTLPAGAVVSSATLEMAADNSYEVWLGGASVGADSTELNYLDPPDVWDITAAVSGGENTLEFEVWNWPLAGGTAYTNPGGLLYCVTIEYSYEMGAEECDGADNDCDGSADEGAADGDGDGTCDARDAEECDGLDNDGDGAADEGFDADSDGLADCYDEEESDGVDNDGDGEVDEGFDSDGDGTPDHFDGEECDGRDNDGDGVADEGFDADSDGVADCYDAEECDGKDNDGDASTDEGFDADGDGTADCYDSEESDGVDNDGDGEVDEGFDSDGDGTPDHFDSEECDGKDNDGDGVADEGFGDADADGTADCVDSEECDGRDNDGDGAADEGFGDADADGTADCVDAEDCDGADNDGDGAIDEDFDADGDGYTTCGVAGEADCNVLFDLAHGETTFSDPYNYATDHAWGYAADDLLSAGYTWDSNAGALDAAALAAADMLVIAEPLSHFSSAEVDAILDYVWAGGGLLLITDHNEGYVNPIAGEFGVSFLGYSGSIGWVRMTDWSSGHPVTSGIDDVFSPLGSTLSVTDPSVEILASYAGAPTYAAVEYGDGRVVLGSDNEVFARYGFYGAGDPSAAARDNEALWLNTADWLTDCPPPVPADCDDSDAAVNPGADESCDGSDDDCDGAADEGASDLDGDGTCDALDPETCDGIDNDGDGSVDDGFDADADGFTDCFEECEATLKLCSAADGLNTVGGGGTAVATWNGNARWTASISGAAWIWDEYLETSPGTDQIEQIYRNFALQSTATGIAATLEMAADNSYGVWLNSASVGADSTEFNYFAPTDVYDISAAVHAGANTLEFEVWNWAQPGGTAYTNPGGLLYCVTIDYTYEMDAEIADGLDNDCDGVAY